MIRDQCISTSCAKNVMKIIAKILSSVCAPRFCTNFPHKFSKKKVRFLTILDQKILLYFLGKLVKFVDNMRKNFHLGSVDPTHTPNRIIFVVKSGKSLHSHNIPIAFVESQCVIIVQGSGSFYYVTLKLFVP